MTKHDLRWTRWFFSLYSKLMWIPVTFKPVMLGGDGGQMETGEISIRRRIGFKMTQLVFTCQTLFMTIRTLEYVTYGDAGFFGQEPGHDVKLKLKLDWDLVPAMLVGTSAYLNANVMTYLMFDAQRELNRKVFNEFIRLRGKAQSR